MLLSRVLNLSRTHVHNAQSSVGFLFAKNFQHERVASHGGDAGVANVQQQTTHRHLNGEKRYRETRTPCPTYFSLPKLESGKHLAISASADLKKLKTPCCQHSKLQQGTKQALQESLRGRTCPPRRGLLLVHRKNKTQVRADPPPQSLIHQLNTSCTVMWTK